MKVRNQKGTYAKFVVTSLHNSDKEDINEKELENSQKKMLSSMKMKYQPICGRVGYCSSRTFGFSKTSTCCKWLSKSLSFILNVT